MNVKTALDGLRKLSPLLAAARRAEEIARDVARRQSDLLQPCALQRALGRQSRQEAVHAATFGSALAFLPGRSACPSSLARALHEFEARLNADVAQGALAASMFGLQSVLESLGSVALQPPEGELATLGDRFLPLRGLLLQQELGHRRLGEVWVARFVSGAAARERGALMQAGRCYLELAEALVAAGLQECESFAADRLYYEAATGACLRQLEASLTAAAGERSPNGEDGHIEHGRTFSSSQQVLGGSGGVLHRQDLRHS